MRGALLLAALLASACNSLRHIGVGLDYVQGMVHAIDCHDGAPARILVDPHCRDGVCGITCAPDRWLHP
jgi:predicted small secreted protein